MVSINIFKEWDRETQAHTINPFLIREINYRQLSICSNRIYGTCRTLVAPNWRYQCALGISVVHSGTF